MKFNEPTVEKVGTPYPPKFPEGIPTKEQIDAAKKAGVEPVIDLDLGRGVTIKMIFIPPGQFMGLTANSRSSIWVKYMFSL